MLPAALTPALIALLTTVVGYAITLASLYLTAANARALHSRRARYMLRALLPLPADRDDGSLNW